MAALSSLKHVYSVFEQNVENFHGFSFCYSSSQPGIPDPKMLFETNIWSEPFLS